jgi:hypothetical protein
VNGKRRLGNRVMSTIVPPQFETMCMKQNGLTMISEDPAKIYVIETKRVSQFIRGKGNKKKGANI